MPTFQNTLCHLHTYSPMKMEQTQCSVTAFELQTSVNHTEESTRHSEHSESLKSRIYSACFNSFILKYRLVGPSHHQNIYTTVHVTCQMSLTTFIVKRASQSHKIWMICRCCGSVLLPDKTRCPVAPASPPHHSTSSSPHHKTRWHPTTAVYIMEEEVDIQAPSSMMTVVNPSTT
jgi:hypothetical protein